MLTIYLHFSVELLWTIKPCTFKRTYSLEIVNVLRQWAAFLDMMVLSRCFTIVLALVLGSNFPTSMFTKGKNQLIIDIFAGFSTKHKLCFPLF